MSIPSMSNGEPTAVLRALRRRACRHNSVAVSSEAPHAAAYARTIRALGTDRPEAAR
ncbi:hypothetical protein [Streptomyces sp. NPDC020298]|uniref:hypothetical protein n=1 Tax=unclassified Streptomyces TaxID=2593676 RepID=UPI0033E7F523